MVEYALGVTFLCVVSIGAIQFMEDEASDDFNGRADRAGAPDLVEATDGSTTGGSSTGGSDGTDDGGPAPVEVFLAEPPFSGGGASGNPSDWTAKITVTVVDGSGDGIDGATITGFWSYTTPTGTVTQEVTGSQSGSQGRCTFQISGLPANASDATFTVTGISGGVPPVVYNGDPVTSDPITR